MGESDERVTGHYARPGLLAGILAGLEAAGADAQVPRPEDLAGVDHFHLGGVEESARLAALAGLAPGTRVLDVGGGIGGAARLLAARFGCHATVVDLCPGFCAVGEELTRRTGLAERVAFRCASALDLPFEAGSFDAAWTQHSSMNVQDKERLYAEIRRVLRPGARLAIHEIVSGREHPLHFPVPWAHEPSISHLRSQAELRETIRGAGFRELAWHDVTDRSREWLRERSGNSDSRTPARPVGIHLVLGAEAPSMFANLGRNLDERRVEVVQAVFEIPFE